MRYDETRLFHVAVTRASERLLVTAVRSDDEQPSVYLDLVDPIDAVDAADEARPFTPVGRALTMRGLVGQLRRGVDRSQTRSSGSDAPGCSPGSPPRGFPGADPASWWALRARAGAAGQTRGAGAGAGFAVQGRAVRQVQPALAAARQWRRRAQEPARRPSAPWSTTSLPTWETSTRATLRAEIDRRWPQLGLPPGWVNERKRAEAHAMAGRLADYLASPRGARLGAGRLRGRRGRHRRSRRAARTRGPARTAYHNGRAAGARLQDRVERATQGRRSSSIPSSAPTRSPSSTAPSPSHGVESGGAALLQLGKAANKTSVTLQVQAPLGEADDPGWARDLVVGTAEGMAGAVFPATAGRALPDVFRARPAAPRTPTAGRSDAAQVLGSRSSPRPSGSGHRPTPEQAAVIEAPPGPVLVVAGAGQRQDRDDGRTGRLAGRQRLRRARPGPGADLHPQGGHRAGRAGGAAAAPAARGRACGRPRPTTRAPRCSAAPRPSRPTTRMPAASSTSTRCAWATSPTPGCCPRRPPGSTPRRPCTATTAT